MDLEQNVSQAIDSAFENLAYVLDEIAGHEIKSPEMMAAINKAQSDFAAYYADWMQGTWEWEAIEL